MHTVWIVRPPSYRIMIWKPCAATRTELNFTAVQGECGAGMKFSPFLNLKM